MKKRMFKNCLVTALGCAFVAFAGLGVMTASAEMEVMSLDDMQLEMMKGASIRVDDSAVSGIRFSATMDLDDFAWLNENYETVRFGTFIMPAEYGTFTEESLFSENASFYWEGGAAAKAGQKEILQMYSKMYEVEDKATGEAVGRINGSILEVNPANYDKEFVGVGYMELTKDGVTTYKLATANDNERTILYVAQRALEEEGWSETDSKYVNTQSFLDDYTTSTPDATVEYTVTKIYPTVSGGTTTVTETRTAAFNEKVVLTEENCHEDYYVIDQAASLLEGTAYAQDKLSLTVRYAFNLSAGGVQLLGADVSSAYAIEYTEGTTDKWTMLAAGGNWMGIKITSTYVEKALANNAKQLVVFFGNNAGSGFGFDATEYPAGATETGSLARLIIPLDATADYSDGLTIKFYQHDGVGPGCKNLWMTISEVSIEQMFAAISGNVSLKNAKVNGEMVTSHSTAAGDTWSSRMQFTSTFFDLYQHYKALGGYALTFQMRFTSAPSTMQFWQINTSGGFGAAPTLEDYIADGTVTVLGNNAVAQESDMVQGEWYTVVFDLAKMDELGKNTDNIGLQLGVLADLELKNVAFKKI